MNKRRLLIGLILFAIVAAITAALLRPQPVRWKFATAAAPFEANGFTVRQWKILDRPDRSFQVTCVTFVSEAVEARLIDLPQGLTPSLELLGIVAGAQLTFNGGYFDADFRPLGLLRVDGVNISANSDRSPLSAALLMSASGELSLASASDPGVREAPSAVQCGPFLVDPGGKPGIHSDGPAAERTVLATDGTRTSLLITSPVSLQDLSGALLQNPQAFGLQTIEQAVNLDGGPSTGASIRIDGRPAIVQEPRGRIRSAVTLKTKVTTSPATRSILRP